MRIMSSVTKTTSFLLAFALLACNGDDNGAENTGASCDVDGDCYPGIDQDQIPGYVTCLDRVEGGYCTHTCASDSDCCTVEGECESGVDQVCAPFESAGDHYCFLSCEVQEDGNAYCQEWAHPDFICRSTGGGTDNEKVCVPEG